MKYVYFILFLCLFTYCKPSQSTQTLIKQTENFPKSWVGTWQGTLEIFRGTQKMQDVFMELDIQPIDSSSRYTWAITYGEGEKASKRPYELVPIEPSKGHYQTDEKNSIFLDAYYLGGTLYSRFEVQKNLLMVSTWKQGEQLIYDIVVGNMGKTNVTGNDTLNKIPAVTSFELVTKQRAVLSKIK